MKRISSLIALMLLLFVSNTHAQRGWDYEQSNVAEIIPGEDHFYVLQQGFGKPNTALDLFLNSGSEEMTASVNNSCIYHFIEVGKKESGGENFKIFILKNLENGQYVSTVGGQYTASPMEAFQFTARKARAVNPKDANQFNKSDWNSYSNAVNESVNAGAEEGGHWIFCSPDAFKFLTFDHNPGFSQGYIVNTNWRVYVAKEREMSAREKFLATYDQYFSNFNIDESFVVGINPGCISQEMYDEIKAVYDEANAVSGNPNLKDEEYNATNQKIKDVFKKSEESIILVGPGYFVIENMRQGYLTIDNVALCDGKKELPEAWTLDNVKYVWQIEASADGKFFIKNVSSNSYMGNKANEFKMTEEPKAEYTAPHRAGEIFYLNDGEGYLNAKQNTGNLTHWADLEGIANHWRFFAVNAKVIDSLKLYIDQNNLNKKLENDCRNAELTLKGLQTKSGLTMDGFYAPNASGLASSFVKCNASDNREGSSEKAPFDRNVETFYHTMWSNNAPAGELHWGQLDFGEAVQDIYIKMTKRADVTNSNPTRIALIASEGDNIDASVWDEMLYEDTVIYNYTTVFKDTIADSTTFIKKIHLTRPAQHVRFTATKTIRNKYWNEGGPTWNIAELRFYKAENCVPNPTFDLIPKEIINNLETVISKANAEIEAGKATQSTIDELQAAIDAMWEAYPNPSALKNLLQDALLRLEVAAEAENATPDFWGYYHKGAKAEFEKAITPIREALENEDKVLTLEDIKNLEEQLEAASKVFNSRLITPEEGVYHIICAPGTNENGEEYAEEGGYMASANADVNTPAAWGYKEEQEIESRWNALWKIEKGNEGGVAFKNLANGLYLDNPYAGLTEEQQDSIGITSKIAFSTTPKYISLEAAPEAGKFVLSLKHNRFVNASSQKQIGYVGSPMAIWNDFENGVRSRYTFEAVSTADLSDGSFKINCEENQVQIKSFPFDIKNVYTPSGEGAYKVLGIKDNKIQLGFFEEGENIPAATPFIVRMGAEENILELMPVANTIETMSEASYKYSPVASNGLVSAIQGFEIAEGYGLLFQGKVVTTIGGELVESGTGFFNNELKPTTVDGDLALELKGEISGEGTSISDITVNHNANKGIYTLAGTKVQGISTQGLPKGIYIVDGQKVIVK